jgi:hypothetical protein
MNNKTTLLIGLTFILITLALLLAFSVEPAFAANLVWSG